MFTLLPCLDRSCNSETAMGADSALDTDLELPSSFVQIYGVKIQISLHITSRANTTPLCYILVCINLPMKINRLCPHENIILWKQG